MILLAEETLFSEITTQAAPHLEYNYRGEFVNMLCMLGCVLLLVFVTVTLLKRLMRSRTQHLNQSTGIKILERRVLNSKTSLYLLDILGKGIVISESPSGIHCVTEFPPDVNVEELLEARQEERPSFRDSLLKKVRKLALRNG